MRQRREEWRMSRGGVKKKDREARSRVGSSGGKKKEEGRKGIGSGNRSRNLEGRERREGKS